MNKKAKKIVNSSEKKTPVPRVYFYIVTGLFLIFVTLFTTFKISGDDDVFWHLETGRYISENKVIPSQDVFGFMTEGTKWIPFEWGWDVLSYQVYSLAGYAGVSILRTLIFLILFALLKRLIFRLGLNVTPAVFIFLLLCFGVMDRLAPKPQIISYLFFAVLLYLLYGYKTFARNKLNRLYLLPFVFLIWCNMHMGVLAGIGILGIFYLSELLGYFKPSLAPMMGNSPLPKKDILQLSLIFLASGIVLLINPHGLNTYIYVYSHLNMKMLEDVFEWYSPFNKAFSGSIYFYFYLFFLGASMVVTYVSLRKKEFFTAAVLLVFAGLSLSSSRYTIDFMFITSVFLAIRLCLIISYGNNKKINELFNFSKIPVIVLSILLIVLTVSLPGNTLYSTLNYERLTGFGIDEGDYPVKTYRFIKENNLQNTGNRPFNSFGSGGYLIWELKGKKNFIDSRNLTDDIYYNYKTINNKLPGFEMRLDENNFDYIIWDYAGLINNSSELQSSIVSYLINKPDSWKLVYWDDQSLLFVKNESKFSDIIARHEYKHVNPLFYIYQRDPLKKSLATSGEEVFAEIQRNYKQNPDGHFINSMVKSFKVPVSR
jgi:hypothetical protein